MLFEYAVLLSHSLGEDVLSLLDARLEYKNHRSSFTLMYIYFDLHSWQTNHSNWLYSSCDRSRCPKYFKSLSMSSSQVINTMKHHNIIWFSLQTVQTCPILFDHGSLVSIKHLCVVTCYTLVGLVCFYSSFLSQ